MLAKAKFSVVGTNRVVWDGVGKVGKKGVNHKYDFRGKGTRFGAPVGGKAGQKWVMAEG